MSNSQPGLPGGRGRASRTLGHLRAHLPLYAVGILWALMMALFPSVSPTDGGPSILGAPGDRQPSAVSSPGATATNPEKAPAPGSALDRAPGSPTATAAPPAAVRAGTGITRGGVRCRPGVRQLPYSEYAAPCLARFDGYNGGSTYRGVSATTIRFAVRRTTDTTRTADTEAQRSLFETFVDHFNETFELYGRRVVLEEFNGRGNGIDEDQDKGDVLACADAAEIAQRGYFGVIPYPYGLESGPFAKCAAERGLFVPGGAGYYRESFFRALHPYVWSIRPSCDRVARQIAEYVGKRLAHEKARWAGDPAYRAADRVFGMYIPENSNYGECGDIVEKVLQDSYGVRLKHRIDYRLDAALLPSQAQSAAIKFKSEGVTTLILACDVLSVQFLTKGAQVQQWDPEWLIIGVDNQDSDVNGRTFDQAQAHGHMFGLGQRGSETKLNAAGGEALRAYNAATGRSLTAFPRHPLTYFYAVDLFNKLQVAGPLLAPATIARGLRAMPPGGTGDSPFGRWYYGSGHTAIGDTREVYWHRSHRGFDGKPGTWVETYRGRRFSLGEWPAEEPPIYRNPPP